MFARATLSVCVGTLLGAVLVPDVRLPAGEWSAFTPLGSPRPPAVGDAQWSGDPLDAFVFARLKRSGLRPAPEVSRRVWVRRVTYDLTGLPPAPDAVRRFLDDPRPDDLARSIVVDRLLATPAHGERWARHWLDVVRYGESDGFAIDGERPTLWRYRDYCIRAFNEDRPYDRFVREQLAGDVFELGSEGHVATGFYRLGRWEADNMVKENKRQDYLNEVTTAIGSAFLGVTLECARCHDHKYDPIPTRDFYRLQAFVSPVVRKDVAAELDDAEITSEVRRGSERAEKELARRQDKLNAFREELRSKLAESSKTETTAISDSDLSEALKKGEPFDAKEKKRHEKLEKAVKEYKGVARYAAVACAIVSPGADEKRPETHILLGGDVTSRGEAVTPGFLSAVKGDLISLRADSEDKPPDDAEIGRRELADWIASPRNPLTARVIVNRLWQFHLGAGIVATPNDFGVNGSGASHPELLDYLATRLIDFDWRLKPLHRLIVLSRAYRTTAEHPERVACERVDPNNRLLWRGHFRRLEAEALRDATLAVSGSLFRSFGGPGFLQELPAELGRSFPFFDWDPSDAEQRRRRSIYMFQRRNLVHPMMEAFDTADMSLSCERRQVSVTTPQVFSLVNSEFAHRISRTFAERVRHEVGEDSGEQIDRVFWLAFSRIPASGERERCEAFLREQRELHASRNRTGDAAKDGGDPAQAALGDLCLVAINANEFLYLE